MRFVKNRSPLGGMFLGTVCISAAPLLTKFAVITSPGLGPGWVGVFRCLMAAGFLLLVTRQWRKTKWTLRQVSLLSLPGFFFALDLICWHYSVKLAGAGVGTLLANSQVFYLALWGKWVEKEKWPKSLMAGFFLSLGGIVLLTLSPQETTTETWGLGAILGLTTGIFYTGYILSLRRFARSMKAIGSESRMLMVSFFSGIFALGMVLPFEPFRMPSPIHWVALGALALIAQVVGWLALAHHLPRVQASRSGIILLLQPCLALIFGAILYGEWLSPGQAIGAFLTLGGIYLGVKK